MQIADIEVAKAVIAHEAVDCFLGKEEPASKQPKNLVSCTGGAFWGALGDEWPRSASGKPLIPWLQIVCTEMKGLYGPFYGRQVVCFHIDEEFGAVEAASKLDRSDFVVREYRVGDKLAPMQRPTELTHHKFHRVTWHKTPDYPSISKYYDLFAESVYSALCDDKSFKCQNHSGIKIGGWPTPVQSDQRYPGEFALQIDITENYMYADSGVAYLSSKAGAWVVMFECC
jgi:uncharacterized protein YwqG